MFNEEKTMLTNYSKIFVLLESSLCFFSKYVYVRTGIIQIQALKQNKL